MMKASSVCTEISVIRLAFTMAPRLGSVLRPGGWPVHFLRPPAERPEYWRKPAI